VKVVEPFEVHQIEAEPRSWQPLVTSVISHAVIIAILLLRPGFPVPEGQEAPDSQDAQPIALAPETRFAQPPRDQRQPVPERPIPLGPDSRNPDALVPREQGPTTPPPVEPLPLGQSADPPSEDEEEEEQPPVERIPSPQDLLAGGSIIGRPTSAMPATTRDPLAAPVGGGGVRRSTAGAMGRQGFNRPDTRGFRESFPEAAGQCVEVPDLGRNPDGTPVLASVMGIVRDNRGRPLAGAHLQIVGAPFATFSDGNGNYRLEFDPALLEKCRVQIVRVNAQGFQHADLTLAIGRQVRSDDVVLRRR
jgi:hypothetical protein